MQLDEYLKAIADATEDELAQEYGVGNNYDILLDADYKGFIDLCFAELPFDRGKCGKRIATLYHENVAVSMQVLGYLNEFGVTGIGAVDVYPQARPHIERQLRDYKINISLHPHGVIETLGQEKRATLPELAQVVIELGNFIIAKQISAAFTDTIGRAHMDPLEVDRTVYFP